MADYYTQFSTVLMIKRPKLRAAWDILHAPPKQDHNDEHDPPAWGFQYEVGGTELWLYSEDTGDVESLADCVFALVKAGCVAEPVVIEWAHTCGKMRADGFAGGAMLVTKDEVHWFNPGAIAYKTWDTLRAERKRKRRK